MRNFSDIPSTRVDNDIEEGYRQKLVPLSFPPRVLIIISNCPLKSCIGVIFTVPNLISNLNT